MEQLNCFKRITREEYEEMLSECSGIKWLSEEAHSIEKYPDYRFSTADGRTFGLFQDGERILRLLQNQSVMIDWKNEEGIKQVKAVAGLILEVGAEDRPFIFNDEIELALVWVDIHRQYGVPPTREENEEYLDIVLDGFPKYENDGDQNSQEDQNNDDDSGESS
jgi:hypothetical protein